MAATPALDLDLVRTLVLIAEEKSFTRAAERVGRTQSAVSLQVQRLEAQVGRTLVARSKGGGVELTPHGEELVDAGARCWRSTMRSFVLFRTRNRTRSSGSASMKGSRAAASPTFSLVRDDRSEHDGGRVARRLL